MILILADNSDLARIWARHLERQKHTVVVTTDETEAVQIVRDNDIRVIVLDLMMENCVAFSVADYVSYRSPGTKIIFVTRSHFFSDGSLFRHVPNTAAILQEDSPPSDLAAIVAYHGRAC